MPETWREVDAYYFSLLAPEDDPLIRARESGSHTTMPNAEVASQLNSPLGGTRGDRLEPIEIART